MSGVVFAAFTPFADGALAHLQKCDAWQTCKGSHDEDERDPELIDCLAGCIWEGKYNRKSDVGFSPPSDCAQGLVYMLNCTSENKSVQMSWNQFTRSRGVAAVQWRRLLNDPYQMHSKDWGWKAVVALSTKTKELPSMGLRHGVQQSRLSWMSSFASAFSEETPSDFGPTVPENPEKDCYANLEALRSMHFLRELFEDLWPKYQMMLKVSYAVTVFAVLINCASGYFGRDLETMIDVQTAVPMVPPHMATAQIQPATQMTPATGVVVSVSPQPDQANRY